MWERWKVSLTTNVQPNERRKSAHSRVTASHTLLLARMQVMRLDLADTSSVVEFGKAYSKLGVPLHILINNAGLFAMSAPRTTGDGNFEIHLLTNFISGALLTLLLLPHLVQGSKDPAASSTLVSATIISDGAQALLRMMLTASNAFHAC